MSINKKQELIKNQISFIGRYSDDFFKQQVLTLDDLYLMKNEFIIKKIKKNK